MGMKLKDIDNRGSKVFIDSNIITYHIISRDTASSEELAEIFSKVLKEGNTRAT